MAKRFGLEKQKEISQIINAYLYLPFFLLIILCQHSQSRSSQHWKRHKKMQVTHLTEGGGRLTKPCVFSRRQIRLFIDDEKEFLVADA
jgi:hypothetical protein